MLSFFSTLLLGVVRLLLDIFSLKEPEKKTIVDDEPLFGENDHEDDYYLTRFGITTRVYNRSASGDETGHSEAGPAGAGTVADSGSTSQSPSE